MTDPLGPVVITAREIYDQLVRVISAVERVSGQLADTAKRHDEHEADSARRHDDHETRLRALEKARWPLPALAVLVSIAALALPFLPVGR